MPSRCKNKTRMQNVDISWTREGVLHSKSCIINDNTEYKHHSLCVSNMYGMKLGKLHPVLPLLFVQRKRKKKNTIHFRNTCAIFCLFTLLLIRGNWLDKAQTVTPGAVHALHDAGGQKKEEKKSKRLMLMLAVSSNLLTQLTWFLKSTVAD